MKNRKLFCQISSTTYKISYQKCILIRKFQNLFKKFATQKNDAKLEYLIYSHNSLIRRKLGNVNLELQDNKAVNLTLAAPKVDKIIIKPNEIFSFWNLVGNCNQKRGYKTGLTIKNGLPDQDVGGGMCQFTNLIHWMILHSDMQIVEHHHHDNVDLFPDFKRQVPFGSGTSILYNYKDYRFLNCTKNTYQLIIYTTDTHLCGELRSTAPQQYKYHIKAENEFFSRENDVVYRNNEIYRSKIDKITGNTVERVLIKKNHAKVMYDTSNLEIKE